MGYFGLDSYIKYWSVTCKLCREHINFALYDKDGFQYDRRICEVALECPRCLEKRRYLHTDIWKRHITETSKVSDRSVITQPIFIRIGQRY